VCSSTPTACCSIWVMQRREHQQGASNVDRCCSRGGWLRVQELCPKP
jgi:hypothetical protein